MKRTMLRLWQRARRRVGLSGLVALLLLALSAGIGEWVPSITRTASQIRSKLVARAGEFRPAAGDSESQAGPSDKLADYVALFPPRSQATSDLSNIFSTAQRQHLQLARGEYQFKSEVNSPFVAYTAAFPVHSDYGSIKAFAADVLVTLPHASLDEFRLSRESAGSETLDAVIRFTLTYRIR